MTAKMWPLLVGLTALTMLVPTTLVQSSAAGLPSLFAVLVPTEVEPEASGSAELDNTEPPSRLTFRLQVQHVFSTNLVVVVIHSQIDPKQRDQVVGGIELDEEGCGELLRDTSRGDRVPDVSSGSEVGVFDFWSGELLLSGVF